MTPITPGEVMAALDSLSRELNDLADGMARVARQLEPVEDEYTKFMDGYEITLWTEHVEDGRKLPPAALRIQLAHKAMDPDLYGRYFALVKSRDRIVKRIAALKTSIEAQRSLLSALKEGLV